MRDVAIICGPTAAGKSAIAMALAERTGAMLISADSRQVYRQFDIGTAKPSHLDRATVTHRGIDIIDPTVRYSAAEWNAGALQWIAEADAAQRPVIVVGGTGFYLRTLETPLFESPPLDPVARTALLEALERETTEALRARCVAVDPARAHLGRTQLLRALEMYELTGRPLSEWQRERARESTIRAHYLLVDPGMRLRQRIAERVIQMVSAGWEDEVARLVADVPADAPAWNACGYGTLRAAHLGQISSVDAIERTIIDTRQYAKRQRTWFRHQLPQERVTPIDPGSTAALDLAGEWFGTVSLMERT